jgi:hypothetical protein
MQGYPEGPLRKIDYENLLSMPEHAERAKADLIKLAEIDDSKIVVDLGTEDAPNLAEIDNPMPAWKRAGFESRGDLAAVSGGVSDT